jgi:CheY-like chemotaxis protein
MMAFQGPVSTPTRSAVEITTRSSRVASCFCLLKCPGIRSVSTETSEAQGALADMGRDGDADRAPLPPRCRFPLSVEKQVKSLKFSVFLCPCSRRCTDTHRERPRATAFSSNPEQTSPEAVLIRMGQSENERTVVLLVEDEPLVRMFGADVLEEAGFEVLEAVDGDAALAVLEARPDINVLFTDVNMPGSLDGLDLARLVHARRPDIKLLIASGQVRLGADDIPDAGRFLPKPYAPDAILREIRGLVA